jgi:hypothetical protein
MKNGSKSEFICRWGSRHLAAILVTLLLQFNVSANAADAAAPETKEEPKAEEKAGADAETKEEAKTEEEKPAEEAGKDAVEAEAPAELTPEQLFEGGDKTFANWVEVSGGFLRVNGDKGWAEQRQQYSQGVFGGIQDLHYTRAIDKSTTLTLDGHSIFGPEDYGLSLAVRRENLGYVRFQFENFRNFYDSSGGYFAPGNLHFSRSDEAWELDRGLIVFEAGLGLAKWPTLVFKYTHRYRDGEKDSTIWGPVFTTWQLRGLYPGWYGIDETSDAFELDASYTYKATTFGVGLRYEFGEIDNSYYTIFRPQEPAIRRHLTDQQGTSYDMLSVHAWSETWIKKNISFSTGFLFANLDNDFSGSRIYGEDFDVAHTRNTLNSFGYFDLNGGSQKQEYIANINLMAIPVKNLTVVPSLRIQREDWDAESTGMSTLSEFNPEFFRAERDRDFLDVRERIDIRYNGITNWVFYAGPELTQGQGNLREVGGLGPVAGIGTDPVSAESDDSRFYQKYFAGVRWYPATIVTIDAGGYYKLNHYEWDHKFDSTPNEEGSFDRYPAFFEMQDFETYDANVRLTFRPFKRVTLVSRYEYQDSTVTTAPDAASEFDRTDSSYITSHIFGQNVSWTPWSRLTLQLGFNYVESQTETPTSEFTQAVLDAKNNYLTLNANAGFVLDDKTDLNLGYFYYVSDNYRGNPEFTLPLGTSSEEHSITAGIVRRISQSVRLNLRYGYAHFNDDSVGGNDSYEAHLVYSSLQYRF